MPLYSFKQKLSDKDLTIYDYYLLMTTRSLGLTSIIMGIVFVALGVYGLVWKIDGNLVINIITIVIGGFLILLLKPVSLLIIYIKHRTKPVDLKEITVEFYDNGILYKFSDDKTQDERDVVIWENVKRIYQKGKYFYVYLYNGARVLLLNKDFIDDFETFDNLMDEYLLRGRRYLPRKHN